MIWATGAAGCMSDRVQLCAVNLTSSGSIDPASAVPAGMSLWGVSVIPSGTP